MVTYAGVALGAVNVLFIYPACLQDEELGLFQFMVSWAMILSPLVMLGTTNLVVRFFPVFRDEAQQHRGFLFLMLLLNALGFVLFTLLVWLFQDAILDILTQDHRSPLMRQYAIYIVPLTLFVSLNALFINYIKNFLRIVVPSFFENIFVKIATGTLALLLFAGWVELSGFVRGIVVSYALVTLGLIFYTRYLGQLYLRADFSMLKRPLTREMAVFAYFGILGNASSGLMLYIDKAMLPLLIDKGGLDASGIYTIVGFIGAAIDIPRKSLEKITTPVVAHSIQAGDWDNIRKLYSKSAINQLIVGCLLLLGIWLNLDYFFDIMPNGEVYRPWKLVVLMLGISSIIDMATGINSQIISYSQYFRFNFYLALILGLLNVLFNIIFIRFFQLNIYGTALATLTSITIYNLIKYTYIYRRLGMQPFSWATLGVLLLAMGIYIIVVLVPPVGGHPVVDILIRSVLIVAMYVPAVLWLRLSPDFNLLWTQIWQKIRSRR